MGLINFIKSAGAAMFGSKEEERKIEAELQAKSQTQIENLNKLKAQRALELRIEGMGLPVEGADVDVDGHKVTLRGRVKDQATAERVVLVVGNVDGVEVVDNQLEVTNPEPEATFYTVEKGDTLSKIAKEHYGNANKYHAIFEANKPMLTDPDKIYPGQVLRIPPMAEKA
jgi:nucleoid-associated protein YgaU